MGKVNIIKTGGTISSVFKDWCDDFDDHEEMLSEGDEIINVQHCRSESGIYYFMLYVKEAN